MTAAAHFPGVDLRDGNVPATNLHAAGPASAGGAPPGPASAWSDSADLAAAGHTRAEPTRTVPPGAEHPSSAETDHSSASWWEKSPTQPGPTRAHCATTHACAPAGPGDPRPPVRLRAKLTRRIWGVYGEPACRRPVKALESKTRFRGHRPGP